MVQRGHISIAAMSFWALGCTANPSVAQGPGRNAPIVDYHQHLVSVAYAPFAKLPLRDGAALVREMDQAGVEKAVVLSVGYSYGDERKHVEDPDRMTRDENDWTSSEVMKHAARLVGFCSANPLRAAALPEIERCLSLPGMIGIKVHLGNNGISLRDSAQLGRIQALFALAERLHAPVLIHMRARGGLNFGGPDAQIFLDKVVPLARHIEIVIAHLGTSGPGYSPQNDEIMSVFGAAAQRHDPRMRNLYFDVATIVTEDINPTDAASVASHLRQVGVTHVLYGSDLSPPGGSIRAGWDIFRSHTPLTASELQQIATNRTRFITNSPRK